MEKLNYNLGANSYFPKGNNKPQNTNSNLEVITTVVQPKGNYNKGNSYNKGKPKQNNKNWNSGNNYNQYNDYNNQGNDYYNNNNNQYSTNNQFNQYDQYNQYDNNQYYYKGSSKYQKQTKQGGNSYYNQGGGNYETYDNYDTTYSKTTNYQQQSYQAPTNYNPNTNVGNYSAFQYYGTPTPKTADLSSYYSGVTSTSNSVKNKDNTVNYVTRDDLEDDYYVSDVQGNLNDMNLDYDEDMGYDDNLEDDLYDGGNYDNYDYYEGNAGTTGTTGTTGYNYQTTNSNYENKNKPSSYISQTSTATSKHKDDLVFSNKESFTQMVDNMINKNSYKYEISDNNVNVLMIAEKPSIALSIATALSSGKPSMRNMGRLKVYKFSGYFQNAKANFTVSSVMGHVYTTDFLKEHNQWNNIDFADLYDVEVVKLPADKKSKLTYTLQKLAYGQDIVCLWLDCDKEGENISYEVLCNVLPFMNKKKYQQVYRAKFSSLSKQDLRAAYNNLKNPPNKNESLSVDARQIIDLKIGVSFTRFLTSAILPAIQNQELKLLSYGPCQTPTLYFCVERQQEIDSFKPKEYYTISLEIEHQKVKYQVPYKKHFFIKDEVHKILNELNLINECRVENVVVKRHQKQPPVGLNTVHLLRTASSYLKLSPHKTMIIAEKLYTSGLITYPRTESTKYAPSFDFKGLLNSFASDSTYGGKARDVLKNYSKPNLRGVDVGDHPPITPASANHGHLKGDYLRLYDFIVLHFLASLATAAEYEEREYYIKAGDYTFVAEGQLITYEGFLGILSHKLKNYEKPFPNLNEGLNLTITKTIMETKYTQPREKLSESDLIKLMEENKIGTDASMPTHIKNICDRNYVKVDSNRRLTPTTLGKCLIESLGAIDKEIVNPNVRSQIEGLVDQISKGTKSYEEVISYSLKLYKDKFHYIRQFYDKIIETFRKYFRLDTGQISAISKKIRNKNEELKIKNMKKKDPREVTTDLKECSDCRKGKVYVEFDEFDKYLLLCTNCNIRKKIVRDARKITVIKDNKCEKCSSNVLFVDLENPFLSGETEYTGCLFCDVNLS